MTPLRRIAFLAVWAFTPALGAAFEVRFFQAADGVHAHIGDKGAPR